MVAERSGTFFGVHMTGGEISTVAGLGSFGFAGDGGPATRVTLMCRRLLYARVMRTSATFAASTDMASTSAAIQSR